MITENTRLENINLSSINIEDIPLFGIITIDKYINGRFDIIINKYYNGEFKYLPILLFLNNINDISEVTDDIKFNLFDIKYIENQLTELDIETTLVPGINKTLNTKSKILPQNNSSKSSALPKLNISLEKVSYDPITGRLKY